MLCKICGKESKKLFKTTIRNKYKIDYFECDYCKFIQTETPYWLDEAYASPINDIDTGLLGRNILYAPKVANILFFLLGKNETYVDYGGGYGVFTRLMRDIGFNYYWIDPKCENLHARGFEWDESIRPKAITLFETFEHFVDPRTEVKNLLNISKNIIFSTTLAPIPTPDPEKWWYYGREHGQHVALYRKATFEFIAQEEGTHYTNFGSLHLFTEKPISRIESLLLLKGSKLLFPIVKRQMKSKTFSDMHDLIKKKG
jgi:hypothetical protein